MEQEKIGNLIAKLRKEKGYTQQELATILGISPKTISKWECGNGLPDITFLKKISDVLEITIEELLAGKLQSEALKEKDNSGSFRNKNFGKKIIIPISILMIAITVIIIIVFTNYKQKGKIPKKDNCIVVKTYYIDNIGRSNDENYLYITVHEYQVEGTYTLKLPKLISKELEVGNSYEFTFKTDQEFVKATTDILFNNSNVINLEHTNKVGNEIISTYECD